MVSVTLIYVVDLNVKYIPDALMNICPVFIYKEDCSYIYRFALRPDKTLE